MSDPQEPTVLAHLSLYGILALSELNADYFRRVWEVTDLPTIFPFALPHKSPRDYLYLCESVYQIEALVVRVNSNEDRSIATHGIDIDHPSSFRFHIDWDPVTEPRWWLAVVNGINEMWKPVS